VVDDIMVMYAGQIVEKANAKEAVFDPLHPYAKGLMGSIIVPEKGLRGIKLAAIPGVPPNLKNPPAGCRFAERCKFAQTECMLHSVILHEVGGGRAFRCNTSEDQIRRAYQNGR
jgi:peptide/nickel transport system ATP-binding protein